MNRRDKNNQVRRERLKKEGKRSDLLAVKVRLWFSILFLASLPLYGAWLYLYNKLINSAGSVTSGVIVNEKNWTGGRRWGPRVFTYSYKFTVDGRSYINDSKENNHEIGEKVDVEYLDFYPSINRIKK